MAKNSVRDFDATAANNTDIQSVNIAEGCAPSGINNAIRELMADMKDVSTGTIALESPQADSMTVTGTLTVGDGHTIGDDGNDNLTLTSSTNENIVIHSTKGFITFGKDASNEWFRTDDVGNLLVGTTTAGISNSISTSIEASGLNNSRISVNHSSTGSSNGSLFMGFGYGGNTIGSITQASISSVAYNTSSDYRLKENVTDIADGITRLKLLNPSRFNFIANADTTVDGFLAHEVSDVVPEAITGEKDAMMDEEYEVTPAVLDDDGNVVTEAVMGTRSVPDYQGIDQSKLVPLLTAALQEAVAKIEALETRVAALEA